MKMKYAIQTPRNYFSQFGHIQMSRFTALTAALLLSAGVASAQDTTAANVGGPSGVPGYPTTVVGANGITYACGPLTAGVYNCVIPGSTAGAGFGGIGGGAGAGLVAAIVLAAVISDSTNGTNGTN
jgi:hypothetical protein